MAKEKKKREHKGEPINFWVGQKMASALRAYLDGTKPRVSKTAALKMALCEFLAARGHPVEDEVK